MPAFKHEEMSLVMPSTFQKKPGKSKKLLLLAWIFASLIMNVDSSGLMAQSNDNTQEDAQFKVLDVTTGSGSKTKGANALPIMPAPVDTLPPGIVEGAQLNEEDQKRVDIYKALGRWHNSTLTNYNYKISSLVDPFMPIKAVRGTVDGPEAPVDMNLPPILRLSLSQLNLVAITVLSDRPGGALAMFEDGVGQSYILKVGDYIGRNKGVVTKIESSLVIVTEPSKKPGQPGKDTPFTLKSVEGIGAVTRTGVAADGTLIDTPAVVVPTGSPNN